MAPEDEGQEVTVLCPGCETNRMKEGHELCTECSLRQYDNEPGDPGLILEGET